MTDVEVSGNFPAVLENVRKGVEIVVEKDNRPVAVIRLPQRSGRSISDCIASAKASGSRVTLDGGFAHDVEEGIKERQEPLIGGPCHRAGLRGWRPSTAVISKEYPTLA